MYLAGQYRMTKEWFPLCTTAGLKVIEHQPFYFLGGLGEKDLFIRAADVEALLASAPKIVLSADENYNLIATAATDLPPTHTARLIMIQPVVQDTADSLLRDYINAYDMRLENPGMSLLPVDWVDRARKLLGDK